MSVKKLMESYTKDEAVKSFVFPVNLSRKQQEQARNQLKEARAKLQAEAKEKDLLAARLMQFKFQLEDYIQQDTYDPGKRFGNFLKAYLAIIHKKSNDFAHDIKVHKTLVSQWINNSRKPNEEYVVRLELHSNNSIPADYWYRVIQKEQVHMLRSNMQLRQREQRNVLDKLALHF
jgi:plasmid maintenance system antidote protein VapI